MLGLDVKVQAFTKYLSSSVYQAGVAVKLIYLLLFSMFRVFATLYILVECTSDLIKYEKASGLKVHHTEVAVIVTNLFKFVATCSTLNVLLNNFGHKSGSQGDLQEDVQPASLLFCSFR